MSLKNMAANISGSDFIGKQMSANIRPRLLPIVLSGKYFHLKKQNKLPSLMTKFLLSEENGPGEETCSWVDSLLTLSDWKNMCCDKGFITETVLIHSNSSVFGKWLTLKIQVNGRGNTWKWRQRKEEGNKDGQVKTQVTLGKSRSQNKETQEIKSNTQYKKPWTWYQQWMDIR